MCVKHFGVNPVEKKDLANKKGAKDRNRTSGQILYLQPGGSGCFGMRLKLLGSMVLGDRPSSLVRSVLFDKKILELLEFISSVADLFTVTNLKY